MNDDEEQYRSVAIKALEEKLDNDLINKIQDEIRTLPDRALDEPYCKAGGLTRREVLSLYEKRERLIKEAVEWLKKMRVVLK